MTWSLPIRSGNSKSKEGKESEETHFRTELLGVRGVGMLEMLAGVGVLDEELVCGC